ncbi:AMP-binding protein [Phenylobacterium sp.]|uniref:AMP-binding protein n=1 Tax=Phenylobacterium sp. TaxID=1871053 RepID=UPI002F955309
MSNLSRCVRLHAERSPDRTALVYEGARTSYASLWDRICRLAGWLQTQGIGKGDAVAAVMKNSSTFIELSLAVSHLGGLFVPVNYRLSADEIDYILADSGAKLLFCDDDFSGLPLSFEAVRLVGPAAQKDSSQLGAASPERLEYVEPGEVFRIMYTSGTTDRPKGVMHTYANWYAKSADQIMALQLNSDSRLLVAGPLYHVGAYDFPGVAVLWAGGTLCIQREFDATTAFQLIHRERLNCAWFAPVMTTLMLSSEARGHYDLSSLEWSLGGGERTPETLIQRYSETFPRARYIDAYGLTETCGGDTLMEPGREIEKIGSTGRPIALVDLEIRDEDGQTLPAGETGEICLRGPKITPGYWRAPEKTAASFWGKWLRTGDVGHVDADGFLFITDRKKDMIISGGENIASLEIERALTEHAAVKEAAVIAVPNAQWGERPMAFVVLHDGRNAEPADLLEHCRARLGGFKVPDAVNVRSTLPRSASGKVLKRLLREEYERK